MVRSFVVTTCSIGVACISLQYDAMLQRFQSIGVHVAVSSISRGNTNCAKVALAAVGNYIHNIPH